MNSQDQAFPGTSDTRTGDEVEQHIRMANLPPKPRKFEVWCEDDPRGVVEGYTDDDLDAYALAAISQHEADRARQEPDGYVPDGTEPTEADGLAHLLVEMTEERDHWRSLATPIAQQPGGVPADSVKLPTSEAEAELMAKVGMVWLEQHAPHKLKQQAGGVPAGWRDTVQRLVTGFEHVSGIARQWEPDHSSGADRAKWARATEACADVAKLLYATTPPAVPRVGDFVQDSRGLHEVVADQTVTVTASAVQPLSEAQIVKCLVESSCIGKVTMSFESGPYDITRPSINADRLVRAVEAAHGIVTPKEPANGL